MKNLTIAPRVGKRYFNLLEEVIGTKLPEDFINVMTRYSGLMVVEDTYVDSTKTIWEIQTFDNFPQIIELTKEFKENGWGLKVPFAYDPGGWHFCLSFDNETYGKVMINRWTDYSSEEQFLVIADSFDEFINGLQPSPSLGVD